jgi:hypothetical protein
LRITTRVHPCGIPATSAFLASRSKAANPFTARPGSSQLYARTTGIGTNRNGLGPDGISGAGGTGRNISLSITAALDRGCVKRQSPPIIGQFTVVVRGYGIKNTSLRDPRSNNIACFRQVNDFSHGLDPKRA